MKKGKDFIGVGVGAIILNKEGKFFLLKRGPKAQNEIGKWEFPGGSMEHGETFEETVIRETYEEFGIKIKPLKLITTVNEILKDQNQHWIAVGFFCKLIRGVPVIREKTKCSEIGWFTLEEIKKKKLALATKLMFKDIEEKYAEISDFF